MKTNDNNKLFALLLALLMVLSMAACSDPADPTDPVDPSGVVDPSGTVDPSGDTADPTDPTDGAPVIEKHTYNYASESGIPLSISNVLPEAFTGKGAVAIAAADYDKEKSHDVSTADEKDITHYYTDFGNLEKDPTIVYSFIVPETGTYDLCIDLRMKDSQHRYNKITIDAGTPAEVSFILDYQIPDDTIDQIRDDTWSSFLGGYSLDLAVGQHTLTITLAKTESHKTAHFRGFYLVGTDTNEDYVAKVNDTWYNNFAVAMIAADESAKDAVVTMFADAGSPNTVTMKGSNNVTLNGNGYTYTTSCTDSANNQAFVLQKTAGELTISNMHIEHDAKKFVFRIDTPAVVNLVDLTINSDATHSDDNGEGIIYFKEWEDINLNMTRVNITLAVVKEANTDSGTGCKAGIITCGYDNNEKSKTVNITMVDCHLDATQSPTYGGICGMRGVTLNLTLENTTILTGDQYAIICRSRTDLAGKSIVNVTLSGDCVLTAANAAYNNADGYSYGGGNNPVPADITITVK